MAGKYMILSVSKKSGGHYGTIENKHIFYGHAISHLECLGFCKEDFSLIMHRAKPGLKEGMKK
jgi:hypothetical protein